MENKNNLIRSKNSAPEHRYYRSVRYKVDAKSNNYSQSTPMKGIKASSSVKKQSRTNFSTQYPFTQNSTQPLINPEGTQESFNCEIKRPYLQTWHRLLDSNNKQSFTQQMPKGPRVYLPHIIQPQPSIFTALDPLPLPFAHIQRGIKQLKELLPLPKHQMNQIRADLKIIESKITKDLKQTQQIAMNGFNKLRKMLRCDKVEYQESILRFQRNLKNLRQKDTAFKQDFEGTKPRIDVLQDDIFSTRPFDLQSNKQLQYQFPQEYF